MALAIKIDVRDQASPRVQEFVERLQDRRPLNVFVGQRAQNLVRDHLIGLANTRHATAERLGARPSGFLTKAAEKVARADSLTADQESAAINVAHPGLTRAFRDVTIRPGTQTPGAKFLTIPLVAEAYNKRARTIEGLFVAKGRSGKAVLAKKNSDGSLKAFYALVPSVVQKQDRSLLPSDQQITNSALEAIRDFVRLLISQQARTA